jgi:hypothetical protein
VAEAGSSLPARDSDDKDCEGPQRLPGWRAPVSRIPPCVAEVFMMMRATFFAIGLFVTLWGVGFLVVDKMVLNMKSDAQQGGFRGLFNSVTPERARVIDPPDWAAFSLMSVGTVTMLYSVALPKKPGG